MFRRTVGGNTDLWSIEASRNVLRRLTSDPARDYEAVWSAGGERVAFNSDRVGVLDLYEASVSGGSTSAALLLDTSEHKNITDWSADGRFVLYMVQSPTTASDIWVLPLSGDRKPSPLAHTAAGEGWGRFSPDGRWVAYSSDETGRSEVYVQTFPDLSRKVQISTAGGSWPLWRGAGGELFYLSRDNRLMAARIGSSGTQIDTETPSILFPLPAGSRVGSSPWYAASRDGQRFLIATEVAGASPITLLLNWKPGN